ncbi:hypothetical protein FHS00_000337 [Limimaricola variabilis]|uniref:Cobalamin biosynthesis protein CbiX n=1 Tax=Limimaricola variabilis TaxID=1492771 RepID=A0ABR6HJQ6_9RHOB|nr:hypothetical protein [Limimaricola variabilis]MBB3710784.1 hypothetical protein [Limimaricola variabilis]WPY95342.1 hypothetical protein T8T21_04225 [Limimaricola variabilis]
MPGDNPDTPRSGRPLMLIVGQFANFDGAATLPVTNELHCVRYCGLEQLSAELLERLSPAVVVSALFGPRFDALELAQHLAALGYHGPYRVLGAPLPDPAAVRMEIAQAAPQLDVELLARPGFC